MKTLLLLVLAVTLLSCSKDEIETVDCNCTKEVYESVSYTYWSGGLPRLGIRNEFRYSEVVPCQKEINFVETGNGMYYDIVCK